MKKAIFLLSLLLGFTIVGLHARSNVLAFDPFGKLKSSGVCSSNAEASKSTVCTETGQNNPVSGSNGILIKATDLIAVIAGVAAVIMIIIGGLQYILSTGDSSRTNSAKNTILYAVIGLVIIVVARTIVVFVVNRL